jgi:integrase
MARQVRNSKIDTRSARSNLPKRREPHWTVISSGCAIGYRKGAKAGTWIARIRDDAGKQHYEALGAADDARDADGLTVFTFAQAQENARAFFDQKAREFAGQAEPQSGPYTVSDALKDYFEAREHRGSKGVKADRHASDARIVPKLGKIELPELTTKNIRDWHTALAGAAKLVRTKKTAPKRATKALDASDQEAVRARRSTANRVLTILKASLNHAFQESRIGSDEAWRRVKPFRGVDKPVVHFLTGPECQRLVNACAKDFRNLVRGALVTGCRYGELTRMHAGDFNADAGTITVRLSKAGKPRHVALTADGRKLFLELTAGRSSGDLIFRRDSGAQWLPSQQQRPLEAASTHAKIEPAATFHILRHTYASTLAMKGVPMGVIAAQLGHSDTRMTEKHYAHIAPSYVADTIRAALPDLGIEIKTNVIAL